MFVISLFAISNDEPVSEFKITTYTCEDSENNWKVNDVVRDILLRLYISFIDDLNEWDELVPEYFEILKTIISQKRHEYISRSSDDGTIEVLDPPYDPWMSYNMPKFQFKPIQPDNTIHVAVDFYPKYRHYFLGIQEQTQGTPIEITVFGR